ncbi:O-antigen ligase family protein [Halanaerobium saccharolyticum]|uniref:O-antigen ligase family protein n=1 Tax=Halanaerobium saccharolyticum TaxID=43595 RepID=UPI00105BEC70|nr:O-antigen ligase family protein [Halanaerobium saccharolyticum]
MFLGSFNYILFYDFLYNFLILVLPFLLYFIFSKYNKSINEIKFYIILLGDLIAIQVFLFSFFYKIFGQMLGWSFNNLNLYHGVLRTRTTVGSSTVSGVFLFIIFGLVLIEIECGNNSFFNKVSSFLLGASIFLTFTRSAISAFLFFVFFYLLIKLKSNPKQFYKFLVIIIIIITIIAIVYPEIFINNYERFFTKKSQSSNNKRLELFYNTLDKSKDYFLFGTGIGLGYYRISDINNNITYKLTNPHNQHAALLLETGIVGYLLFLIFVFTIFITYRKLIINNKRYKLLFLLIFILVFWVGQFETFITSDLRTSFFIWLPILILKGSVMFEKRKRRVNFRS